ncbi:MAG: D-tyrosyl-tRNA(Tyr) deacylase [Planctomycetes bacterium]|jgi:D-tyrosyl-tRNA(Tyr) deacylase|nr:D-tyrosyl-tRNA(Tyr) deacylase [Phycisphaerae bacterium]NBB96437.1 D-tyrosyl-tRNA(Tyr) deacylase [Planctomycetota bacterium]
MRAVLQRVAEASVEVDGRVVGQIGPGLLVYVGVAAGETHAEAVALARKVAGLRIFDDPDGKLNLSVQDAGGAILVVPNFTLQADTRKGRRPSFVNAAPGQQAEWLTRAFVDALVAEGAEVARGVFGADMTIRSVARGPVNVVVDIPTPEA